MFDLVSKKTTADYLVEAITGFKALKAKAEEARNAAEEALAARTAVQEAEIAELDLSAGKISVGKIYREIVGEDPANIDIDLQLEKLFDVADMVRTSALLESGDEENLPW